MAALSTRVHVMFVTRFGFEFAVVFYVAPGVVDPNSATIQAIVAALQQLTGAWGFRIEISASNPHAATPVTSQVYVNEDKAEFVMSGAGGIAHTFKLPAPKSTIIGSDNETIDASSGLPLAFVQALHLHAQGRNGETLTAPLIGKRRAARKSLKK